MKTKKINLNWQSFLLGIMLCTLVVVFLGSKPYDAQQVNSVNITKAVTMADLLAKYEVMEKKIVIMNQRLIIIETKLNDKFVKLNTKLDEKLPGIEKKVDDLSVKMHTALNLLNGLDKIMWEKEKKK